MQRQSLVVILLCALVLTACSTAKKIGAGAALPFAAIGDSVLLPFQGMGRASGTLIELGDEHLEAVRKEHGEKPTVAIAELTTGILYVPGYLLWPLDAAMPSQWYPMTKACNAVLDGGRGEGAGTNGTARATGGFQEW